MAMDVSYHIDDTASAVQGFSTYIAEFQSVRTDMQNVCASVISSWTGEAQQSFDARQQEWDSVFFRYIEMVEEMKSLLESQTTAAAPVRDLADSLMP